MKRKIVALILALTFCLSLSATAFAGTVRESGQTNGKTSQMLQGELLAALEKWTWEKKQRPAGNIVQARE